MDTLKILLGATMALLIGAVVVSMNRMNHDVAITPQKEMVEMRRQLFEMEQEMQRMQLEKERLALREAVARPSGTDLVTREEIDAKATNIDVRLLQLEAEAEEAREDTDRAEREAGFLVGRYNEDRNKMARRVRLINEAMKMATVKEWVNDPSFGGFAILHVDSPENVQPGTVLAIRRNGGVLGKLRVGEVTLEGAVANPITAFEEVFPEKGDELILDEVVRLAN